MVRVLIVEDDADIRDYLVEIVRDHLEDRGREAEIEGAVNGLDGLRKLKGLRYDLVFTDLRMPLLSGPNMIRQNRESPGPNGETPIIVITGNRNDTLKSDGTAIYELQDCEVLEKPLLVNSVHAVLEKYLLSKT